MKKNEKRAALLCACAALAVYCLSLTALAGPRTEPAGASDPAVPASAPSLASAAEPDREADRPAEDAAAEAFPNYLLCAVDGEVCLCLEGEIVLHTGVAVSTLPQQDRTALEDGIAVTSQAELTALLEDLGS